MLDDVTHRNSKQMHVTFSKGRCPGECLRRRFGVSAHWRNICLARRGVLENFVFEIKLRLEHMEENATGL